MNIATAQLPSRSDEDRVLTSASGVVVLDGATAFDPEMPSASVYVDLLAGELHRRLDSSHDLRTALADAISATAAQLRLQSGHAPSSTVSVLRVNRGVADLLVLGDSPVVVGRDGSHDLITDTRLAALDLPESEHYRKRLESGAGYDEYHQSLLRSLQRKQLDHRNQPGGYWIAEADPSAADHAVVVNYQLHEIDWVVFATDGASKPIGSLNIRGPKLPGWVPVALPTCSMNVKDGKLRSILLGDYSPVRSDTTTRPSLLPARKRRIAGAMIAAAMADLRSE